MGKNRLNLSDEELIALVSQPNFLGFSGETCGNCQETANVPIKAGRGWICYCGHHNKFDPSQTKVHKKPDLGPSQDRIQEAIETAKKPALS